MTIERLVGSALHAADDFQPSPDLFAKVQRSIDEDAAHRSRVKRGLIWTAVSVVFVAAYLALTVERVDGAFAMSFTALELLVTALMIVIVVVLGPAIRRFGEQYEQDAFRSSPTTGKRVLNLLDIAYYLIFSAFVVVTLVFDPALEFDANLASWIRAEVVRVASLLVLMALLHVALLLALPVAGLVHCANEWRLRMAAGMESTDPVARRIDRVVTIVAWVVAVLVALELVFLVLNLVLAIGAPG